MDLARVNILDLIIILGALQGFIFSVYLYFNPLKNKLASNFLALFILSFSMNCIYYTLEAFGLRDNISIWDFVPFYCSLLIIASFHYFIHFLVHPDESFEKKHYLLFIPFLFQLLVQCSGMLLKIFNPNYLYENAYSLFKVYNVFDVLTIGLGTYVMYTALKKIKQYEADIRENFAEVGELSLDWLRRLLYILFGVWILFTIPTIYELATGYSPMNIYYPMWIATSVFMYWIGYSTYFRARENLPELVHQQKTVNDIKLSENTAAYYDSLKAIMQEQKPFLDQDLNLKKLSSMLDISSGYLSQIINQYEKKNFFDFINGYRVEEVKQLINDDKFEHLNLLGLAFEAGFKSKSTFNLAFKKLSGTTPSAYKKSKKRS